jgi:membrane dipeptidase
MLGGSGDLAAMLDHIDHIVKTIGIDHVGIGTDLSYQHEWPAEVYAMKTYPNPEYSGRWWGNWTKAPHTAHKTGEDLYGSLAWINWPLYTVGLVTRGYTDDQIAKILGQNFLRVLAANQPDDYRK